MIDYPYTVEIVVRGIRHESRRVVEILRISTPFDADNDDQATERKALEAVGFALARNAVTRRRLIAEGKIAPRT